MKQATKRTSLKRCGFHLRVCSVGVRTNVSILGKIKIPSRPSPALSGTDFTATCRLRIPKNH